MSSMEITKSKEDEFLIITLEGDLDASSAILLDTELAQSLQKNEKKILIDAQDLNYISSAGLGVFMSYMKDFEEAKIQLVIYNLSAKVLKVFEILGLDKLIKIMPTKEEAKAL